MKCSLIESVIQLIVLTCLILIATGCASTGAHPTDASVRFHDAQGEAYAHAKSSIYDIDQLVNLLKQTPAGTQTIVFAIAARDEVSEIIKALDVIVSAYQQSLKNNAVLEKDLAKVQAKYDQNEYIGWRTRTILYWIIGIGIVVAIPLIWVLVTKHTLLSFTVMLFRGVKKLLIG